MRLGLKPVVYEAGRLGGRLRSQPFEGARGRRSPSSAACASRAPPPPSTTISTRSAWRPDPSPTRWRPARPSTVIDLDGQPIYVERRRGAAAALQRGRRRLARGARGGGQLRRHAGRDPRARRRPDQGDLGRAGAALGRPQLLRLRRDQPRLRQPLASAIARCSARSASAPAAGTPTSPTRCWRSCASSSPTATRTSAGRRRRRAAAAPAVARAPAEHGPLAARHLAETAARGAPRARASRASRRTATVSSRSPTAGATRATIRRCWSPASPGCSPPTSTATNRLFSHPLWMALDRTRYMQSSKTFVMVDRPFWKDRDPRDRPLRDEHDAHRPADPRHLPVRPRPRPAGRDLPVLLLDERRPEDAAAAGRPAGRADAAQPAEDLPGLDLAKHIIGDPITVSWETDPNFLGAFKGALPGHYRYNRRMYCHFMQDGLPPDQRGIFLAGDDVSWTPGWVEGAVTDRPQRGLGHPPPPRRRDADPDNPGPGDRFDELAPVALPD